MTDQEWNKRWTSIQEHMNKFVAQMVQRSFNIIKRYQVCGDWPQRGYPNTDEEC